jgi:hypothetical protein
LIVSYHYTYVDFTDIVPDYSNEEFYKMRIGPFLIEIPVIFSPVTVPIYLQIKYKDFKINLCEENYNILKINDTAIPSICNFRHRDSEQYNFEENSNLFEFKGIFNILYTPKEFDHKNNVYAIKFFLNENCIYFESIIEEGNNLTERLEIFTLRINNFLKYYRLLDNSSIDQKGFKTISGIIKPSIEFTITTVYVFFDNNTRTIEDATTVLMINFLNDIEPYPFFNLKELGLVDKYIWYFKYRYYSDIILDFRWTSNIREINFLSVYPASEMVRMFSYKNIPKDMRMVLQVLNKKDNDFFCSTLHIRLITGMSSMYNENKKLSYDTLYGYWIKMINSISVVNDI